jgi:RecB family exonuclease
MARHLQNEIAREGFVFRRNFIQTLSGFVDSLVSDFPQAPDSVLYLLVEEAVARVNRPEFRRVAGMPGFCAGLARTISEFSSAGCDSTRLGACLPDAPLAPAFLAVYEEIDRALDRRGLMLRAKRLECAAARIQAEGLDRIATVWLDGFHALPDPELGVIAALARHAEVTLMLPDGGVTQKLRERLSGLGIQEERLARRRASPATVLVRAPNIECEVEEIARRICEQAAAGRPFREIGIIVRGAETYVPLLRTTLERFGIPAGFYFDLDVAQHAVTRFLTGAIDAMLGGWDHAATLAVLRLAPRFADSMAMDRFDFAVREQIPNAGLGALRALAGASESRLVPRPDDPTRPLPYGPGSLPGQNRDRKGADNTVIPLVRLIDSLAALEEWRSFSLSAADWAARFRILRNIYRPARPTGPMHEALRTQVAALDLFDEALGETAQAFEPTRVLGIGEYWRAVTAILRLKPLRLAEGRRNVVHVLTAHEARQWALPVVFVCGMVEKQFPQFHAQDPFFPDAARSALNAHGVRVRTAAEFEREERALFDSALTCANVLVTLTYPEFDARGDRNLPSLFLEDLGLRAESARAARPRPAHTVTLPGPPAIRSPRLLAVLGERTARVSPSGLEVYQQCPFQYFAGRLLRLQTVPLRPEERLGYQAQGTIVHRVLAEWYTYPQDIEPLFEGVFDACCEEFHLPPGYHTERLKAAMQEDLKRFATDGSWPRDRFQSQTEREFTFSLSDSVQVSGRIDRIDTASDGRAYVIDYKYSGAQRVKTRRSGDNLQAPLYWMAAEKALGVTPVGMFFIGLKGGVEYLGWSDGGVIPADPMPQDWLASTSERVLRMIEEMRQGNVRPAPANADNCRFCDSRDVCRIEVGRAALVEGAADEAPAGA